MNEGIVPNDLRQSVEDIITGKKSLYQINSDTFNHAVVNVKAVYEKNVTKAIDKLTNSKTYIFNVEESKEILWDVIFLSKLAKSQAKEDKYGNKTINSSYYKDIFNQKLDIDNLDSKINKVQLLLVSADLEENTKKEIKEAIVILNDLRNALAHNDNNSYETDEENEQIKFHSDSKGSELYCDIPVRYLLKLGSGIVPLPEHETIAREADVFIDYTCTNLNINLKELPNFFYRVKPENLNFLLNICDYDYLKLKDLHYYVFESNIEVLEWISDNYLKDENGEYDISKLKYLPSNIFYSNIEILKWISDNYLEDENDKHDISKLRNLPFDVFTSSIERLEWIKDNYLIDENNKYDISKLKDIPLLVFNITASNIEVLKWIKDNYLKDENNKYDISKLKYLPFDVYNSNINILEWISENYLKDENDKHDISKLKYLPYGILGSNIEVLEWISENYLKDENNKYDISKVKYLPFKVFKSNIETLKWISDNCLKDENNKYDISKLEDIPSSIFDSKIEILEFVGGIFLKDKNGKNEISKLKDLLDIFTPCHLNIKVLKWISDNYLKDENDKYDISKVKYLPCGISDSKIEVLEWISDNYLKDENGEYDISKLKELPSEILYENIEILEWVSDNYLKDENDKYDISKLKYFRYGKLSSNIKTLEWISENYCKDQNGKYDISKLEDLTSWTCNLNKETLEWISENYCKTGDKYDISKLKDLSDLIFPSNIEILQYISENYCKTGDKYDISKLKDIPSYVYSSSIENIKWISENYYNSKGKCDLKILKELPKELFDCDINILNQIGKYNDMNLLKSVLGNGNDKLVALIIYMDSLFSAYDVKRKVTNLDLMNIEFDKVHPNIQSGVDSINRSYNSSNFDNAKEDYFLGDLTEMVKMLFRQFDKMGVQINEEGITNELINSMDDKIQGINVNLVRMLRNASQHFRVEVDEENPNMLIISDYEKEFDFGTISKNVKSIVKISIEDFYKLLKSIELNNEQEKTTEENYAINNLGNNLLQKVKDKYEDIKKYPNKMLTTSFLHTCLKIEGYNSRKVNVNGLECISYTNGEDIFTDTVDNLYETYSSINKTEVFNAATLFIELLEFDKNELLLQDLFDINLIAEELLIADGINYSKKFQNNEVIFEIDGKTKKSINIYKSYKNNKNKTHVFSEVLINECRNAYGIVYSRIR